jgi:hypothetical protein
VATVTDQTLDVHGGAGGVTASYDDMTTCADGLDTIAAGLISRAAVIGSVITDGDVVASTPLSPMTAARIGEAVVSATTGPRGLLPTATELKFEAVHLRASVTAYQTLDRALAAATTAGEAMAAFPALLLNTGSLLPRTAWDLHTWNLPDLLQIPGLAGQNIMDTLYEHPWIVDGLIQDAPGLLFLLSTTIGPVGTAALSLWTSTTEGTPFPPATLEQASADTIAIGELFGLFTNGSPRTTRVSGPERMSPQDPLAPTNLEQTMTGVGSLGRDPGTVRIISVTQPDDSRRWVVEIPGTQEWSSTAGSNPVDLTNNLRLMAGQQTVQNEAILDAMQAAGIPPGEPVMLAGHSQGGITAASLASDPTARTKFNITTVYTAGSPIGRFDIPPDVHVLSLEHTQDIVPRLDGQPNPDHPNWTTINRDPTGDPNTKNDHTVNAAPEEHDTSVYSGTAALVDNSTDPSIVATRQNLTPFFAGDGSQVSVQDFAVERTFP